MPQIRKEYPGKSAGEIYRKVDQVMEQMAQRHSLDYHRDGNGKAGRVSKAGVSGSYLVRDGEVTVDLDFPFFLPKPMRQRVQDDVARKLDELFP